MISSRVIIINPILSLRCLDTRVPSLVEGYKAFVKINLDPSRNKSFNVIDLKDDDHLPYPLRYLFSIYLSSMNVANKSNIADGIECAANVSEKVRVKFEQRGEGGVCFAGSQHISPRPRDYSRGFIWTVAFHRPRT